MICYYVASDISEHFIGQSLRDCIMPSIFLAHFSGRETLYNLNVYIFKMLFCQHGHKQDCFVLFLCVCSFFRKTALN